jgi:UDP-N-acetyl-D-glucosamine dehydrogenase
MPGPNYVNSIRRFWRSFAGIDPISATKAREFLSTFIEVHEFHLWELESTTACELAKLLENSYRAVNIAFIHEWTLIAEEMEVNLFDIVESIHLRKGTHDNMRYPGFGVGGYCLTKDSLLAQWGASNFFKSEQVLSMTLAALSTNSHMPLHTFGLLAGLAGGDLAGKLIAVCGVSYLPEVPDTRNSPTEILVDELIRAGARVMVHDPCATTWLERPDVALTMNLGDIRSADGVVFAVPHGEYMGLSIDELLSVAGTVPIIVDANNIISDEKASRLYGAGCRLHGVGKGHWRRLGYHEWKVGNE